MVQRLTYRCAGPEGGWGGRLEQGCAATLGLLLLVLVVLGGV